MTRPDEPVTAPSPAEVSAYLRSTGWAFLDSRNAWARFRRVFDGQEVVLEVSSDGQAGDYPRRFRELVDDLRRIEQRSADALIRDIRGSASDVIRLRLTGSAANGRIPVELGAKAFQYTRDLLLAAACATLHKRPVYSRKKPATAMEYLRRVNFGPTESGSFVLTVESSVPPRLQEPSPDQPPAEGEPFERLVGLMLAQGAHAARSIVDEVSMTQQSASLTNGIQVGVSSNLCEAIAGLVAPGAAQSLQLQFRWAATRPSLLTPRDVTFESETHPILMAMATRLRESSVVDEYEVLGPVRHLASDHIGNGGTIRVMMMGLYGRSRIVTLTLPEADYRIAHQAHGADQWISCTGELLRAKGTFQLVNPRDFKILPEIGEIGDASAAGELGDRSGPDDDAF